RSTSTFPSAPRRTSSTTSPSMRRCAASGVYAGCGQDSTCGGTNAGASVIATGGPSVGNAVGLANRFNETRPASPATFGAGEPAATMLPKPPLRTLAGFAAGSAPASARSKPAAATAPGDGPGAGSWCNAAPNVPIVGTGTTAPGCGSKPGGAPNFPNAMPAVGGFAELGRAGAGLDSGRRAGRSPARSRTDAGGRTGV